MTESDKITIDELRKQLSDMEDWKRKYQEAADLWDGLEIQDNQHVISGVLLAKIRDFERDVVILSMANTNGCDWIDQMGIMETAKLICIQTPITQGDDDD